MVGVVETTLCDKFISDLRQAGRWFYPGTPVYSTNKTDHRDITEISLKLALSTITTITSSCYVKSNNDIQYAWCIYNNNKKF